MLDFGNSPFLREVYWVDAKLEVVVSLKATGEPTSIRIEALRDPRTGRCKTRAYRLKDVTLQPTYPKKGDDFDREPGEYEVWVPFDLPWTDGDTSEEVIRQALSGLEEKCQ